MYCDPAPLKVMNDGIDGVRLPVPSLRLWICPVSPVVIQRRELAEVRTDGELAVARSGDVRLRRGLEVDVVAADLAADGEQVRRGARRRVRGSAGAAAGGKRRGQQHRRGHDARRLEHPTIRGSGDAFDLLLLRLIPA